MNQRPSGYEPDELPGCSTPQSGFSPTCGGAGGSRTHNPQIRSLMLYPVELRPHTWWKTAHIVSQSPKARKGEFQKKFHDPSCIRATSIIGLPGNLLLRHSAEALLATSQGTPCRSDSSYRCGRRRGSPSSALPMR